MYIYIYACMYIYLYVYVHACIYVSTWTCAARPARVLLSLSSPPAPSRSPDAAKALNPKP